MSHGEKADPKSLDLSNRSECEVNKLKIEAKFYRLYEIVQYCKFRLSKPPAIGENNESPLEGIMVHISGSELLHYIKKSDKSLVILISLDNPIARQSFLLKELAELVNPGVCQICCFYGPFPTYPGCDFLLYDPVAEVISYAKQRASLGKMYQAIYLAQKADRQDVRIDGLESIIRHTNGEVESSSLTIQAPSSSSQSPQGRQPTILPQ